MARRSQANNPYSLGIVCLAALALRLVVSLWSPTEDQNNHQGAGLFPARGPFRHSCFMPSLAIGSSCRCPLPLTAPGSPVENACRTSFMACGPLPFPTLQYSTKAGGGAQGSLSIAPPTTSSPTVFAQNTPTQTQPDANTLRASASASSGVLNRPAARNGHGARTRRTRPLRGCGAHHHQRASTSLGTCPQSP